MTKYITSALNTFHAARNLGVIFDEYLIFSHKISKAAHFCSQTGKQTNGGETGRLPWMMVNTISASDAHGVCGIHCTMALCTGFGAVKRPNSFLLISAIYCLFVY